MGWKRGCSLNLSSIHNWLLSSSFEGMQFNTDFHSFFSFTSKSIEFFYNALPIGLVKSQPLSSFRIPVTDKVITIVISTNSIKHIKYGHNEWWPHLKAQLIDCTRSNQLFRLDHFNISLLLTPYISIIILSVSFSHSFV